MSSRVGVVTGGTRGIGLAIARFLVKRSYSLCLTYCHNDAAADEARERLQGLAGENRIIVLKGDAGDPEVVSQHADTVKKELGGVGVLVNNAGIMPRQNFEEITTASWDDTIRINLSSAFYWFREVVPLMKRERYGRIVNVSSLAARGGGVVGPHYAASKAGMLGLTRYAARELGPHGITVNAIAPAFIEDAGIFREWSSGDKAALKRKTAVKKLGRADDVVRAFSYLIDTPFVTGVTLDVNGGAFMI
ncbi:MAG: SDR family NAD(P)-dependent oxidoreductase [Deltaproteobacteria bacterium]|nr:SDR family NAD(P)-dependent oxidoreductase [Deltaproteobacteria bacterium]